MASSVEEAIGYLTAHSGEAQVLGGGTTLMPLVQRGRALARHLVDVSRVSSLRRIRIDDGRMVVGGAVTLLQLLRTDLISEHLPILQDMAANASTLRLQSLATLAGSVVNAYGHSSITAGLIALQAEAEIANLTGSQWLPLQALLVRPGTSRINSMAEILTSVRIRLMHPGEGAALTRLHGSKGHWQASSVYAVSLGIKPTTGLVSWLRLVAGTPGATPQVCRLDDLVDDAESDASTLRNAVSDWVDVHSSGTDGQNGSQDGASSVARQAFDLALKRARARLAVGS